MAASGTISSRPIRRARPSNVMQINVTGTGRRMNFGCHWRFLLPTIVGICVAYIPNLAATESFLTCLLIAAYSYTLYIMFFGKEASEIPATTKAFCVTLIVPPFSLLIGQQYFGIRAFLVYPSRLTDDSYSIEFMAYAWSLAFIATVLVFSRRQKPRDSETVAQPAASSSLAFLALLSLSVVFATCAAVGDSLALFHGGYAVESSGSLGGINAWQAMAVVALILSYGHYRQQSPLHQTLFWTASAYVVVGCSLLFGKRADVVGLLLVFLAAFSHSRLRISKCARLAPVLLAGVLTVIVVGNLRTGGWENDQDRTLRMARYVQDGFLFPSINDFFGSLPLVINYREFDDGKPWLGWSYIVALSTLLPSCINPYRIQESATVFLQHRYYPFNGGMYLVGELWMNFGKWGLLLCALAISWFLNECARFFSDSRRRDHTAIGFAIISGFPRWVLYGTSSFSKHLFVIFLLCIVVQLVRQSRFASAVPRGKPTNAFS